MADANYDASLKIGLEADLTGGIQTEKQADAIRKKFKQMGDEGAASAGKATSAISRLKSMAGGLRNILTGFGVGAVFAGIVSQVSKVADSFKSAKKAADDLAKVQQQLAADKSLQELALGYERMKDAAASAARELQHAVELGSIALQNASRLDAAERNRSKEIELSNLDESAPDYKERKAAIEARYASLDAGAASYDEEMRTLQERASVAGQVGVKEKEAAAQDEQSRLIKAKINAARVRMGKARTASVALNEYDKTDALSIVGKTFGQLFTPSEWGRVTDAKTPEGDKVRQAAAEKATAAELEIGDLEGQLRKSREEADSLRREAKQLREKQRTFDDRLKAIRIERETSKSSSIRQQKTADLALEKQRRKIAKDEETIALGPGRIAAIEKQIAATEAQQLAAKQTDAKEQMDAILAQQALDSFNAAGHRRNGTGVQKQRSALEAEVERETREATQSRAQLQSTLATLAATLKGLNADLNKVKREVDAATKRQGAINDEAPEG